MQILLQTIPQSLVNSRNHSSNAHTSAPAPAAPLPSRSNASDKPNAHLLCQHRQTLIPSRPSQNPQESCKSCFRQSPQRSSNSRNLSSNAHTSAPAPAAPLPSRKSPKNHANPASDIPPISRKLSSSLVKRSCERTCASGAPPILKIPPNPANPASDNPRTANHSPSPQIPIPCTSGVTKN